MLCQEFFCGFALNWTEPKDSVGVSINHKVYSSATEITHAIKENYGLFIKSLHNKFE